ncbi:uncharacterized protein LOC128608029 [Ictalurus furcatus]|uniref:uncharacterized protein LOC128608029 n=1 Tax=Ictalurus furcatus TaxID=66913 RepID=UPI00234FBBA6|nr:uncharacterized protein LOC128608029 [Ictalurus furcatus]
MRQYLMLFLIFPMPDVLSLQVPCTVNQEEGVEYRKITWYKVSVSSGSLVGLVMKDIHTNTTHLYKFANHSYQVGNDLSLLHVPECSQDECEMYRCCVWPPVGHRILQSDYSLPQGCQSNDVGMTELSFQLQGGGVFLLLGSRTLEVLSLSLKKLVTKEFTLEVRYTIRPFYGLRFIKEQKDYKYLNSEYKAKIKNNCRLRRV